MASRPSAAVRAGSTGASWRLHPNGSFMLCDGECRPCLLRGRKSRALIAYLATHIDERVSRYRLTDLLWPERPASQARASLRQALLEIRRAAPQLLDSDQQHVWIGRGKLELCTACHACDDDILYADLDGVTAEFDDWLRSERAERLADEWSSLATEADALIGEGRAATALRVIERMHRLDPYNEDWLRLAMRAEYEAGHPAGIQTRFTQMAEILERDLGVSLSAQTRALRDELLARLSLAPERPLSSALK